MKSKSLRRHFLGSAVSLLALASFAEVALAKQPAPHESYPATEDSISPGQMEPTPVEVTSSVQIKTRVHAPVRRRKAPQTVVIPSERKTAAAPAYDPVPASQAEPIIKRLKLVEELIRKYGRAYDYRNHTLKQLEGVLASLEGRQGAPATASAPNIVQPKAAAQAGEAADDDLKSLPTPVELDSGTDTVDEI